MLDIGWAELMVIGVVALIVIGPKDLPDMFRTMGRFTAKARSMARDFQRAMDAAANETGVKDIAKDLKATTSARSLGLEAVKDAASKFEAWDPLKTAAAKPAVVTAAPAATIVPAAAPVLAAPAVAAPAAPPAPAPAADLGPNTQALADAQAARRAIATEAAKAMKAVGTAPAPAPAAVKSPGRRRAPAAASAAPAAPAAAAAADPAPPKKPRAPRKAATPKGDA